MNASVYKYFAHFAFWCAMVVIVIVVWRMQDASRSGISAKQLVSHTQEVLHTAAEVVAAVSRGESAQRGYFLGATANYLSDRDQEFAKADSAVARLKQLTPDNPEQQRRIAELEKRIAARFDRMREGVKLQSAQGNEVIQTRAASGVGQQASASIYDLLTEMRAVELGLLVSRRASVVQSDSDELALFWTAGVICIAVLIACYAAFVVQLRWRDKAEKNLLSMANSLPGALYQFRRNLTGKTTLTFLSAGANGNRGKPHKLLETMDSLVNSIDVRDRPGFVAAMDEATKSFGAFRYDYRVTHDDGTEAWLHHEASVRQENDGTILQNGYVADITQQTRINEVLQEATQAADSANRAKSTFLATMSHEIRTPMNGVLGMLELLSLTRLNGGQRTTLEIVRQSSKSLLRIIDDILDFSKIEAGKLEVRPEAVSIRDLVEDLHNIYSGNASSRGVLITRHVDSQISQAVLVDPLRLRQILTNFLSNALKFTTQGSIKIRVELLDRANGADHVRFSVIDTGIGVSAENQERLFQPFSQVDSDESRRVGGTGLGLTICQRLAGMMGGSIEMVSQLGEGTTMTLTLLLPIADIADLPVTKPHVERDPLSTTANLRRLAPSVAQAEMEGTLVLLVDDHPTNRTLLMRQVETLGYAAESAEDGVVALDKWKTGRFSVVITDCNMPEMDGYELARCIRKEESGHSRPNRKRTPIIACTANALGGEAEICFAAGMDDYLVKPVELAQILKKLDQWLPIPEASASALLVAGEHATAAKADPPIDHAIVAAIWGADEATGRDVLAAFRRANDTDAAVLMRAVGTRDMPQITYTAHRMLGASRWVGALKFADQCACIEQASRSGNWDAIAACMDAFQREWMLLNNYFDSL